MIALENLPSINAALNTLSASLLASGFYFIKRKNIPAHRACMLGAVASSIIFLIGYLTYHFNVGTTRFQGEGVVRPMYFTLLLTHTILAVAIVPLVITTLYRALGSRFEAHKRIARWTLPLWLYVSATGVLVYFMLYHWFPGKT
ncbi:MAG: DUF420 domain-containing protein [Fimbriimonadales bacterium]